jgi:hypothetical protein
VAVSDQVVQQAALSHDKHGKVSNKKRYPSTFSPLIFENQFLVAKSGMARMAL